MASITHPLSAIDHGEASLISAVHRDIVEHNILTRLDGLSLASLSCTSSYFNALSSEDSLWRKICTSMWPSLNHSRVQRLISADPRGYHWFFTDSFPLLTPHDKQRIPNRPILPSVFVSAVDILYQNKPIFSRVIETETNSSEFLRSTFRVDLLHPEEDLPTQVKMGKCGNDAWVSLRELEENLTVSWIIFDPITKKSANFSSTKSVSSERHWLPGEYDLEYAAILGCQRDGYMECKVVVTCGGLENGELHLREACMKVRGMDGKYLNGKESLVSLMNAIEFGKRKKRGENESKKMHEEYLGKRRLRWEKMVLKKRTLEIAFSICVVIYVVFFTSYLISRTIKFTRVRL